MGGPKDWGTTNCKRNSINFSFKNSMKIMIIYQIFDYLLAHMGRPKDGGALNCKRNSINFSFKNWKKIKIINKFLFILSKENMQKTLKNYVNRLKGKAALNSGPLQQIQISLGQLFACFATFSMKKSIKNIKTNLWKTAKSLGQRPRIYCRGPELSADLFWAFFLKSFLHFSPMVASNWFRTKFKQSI